MQWSSSAIPIPTASKPPGGFPGGPLVKTMLSNAVGVVIPGQRLDLMPQQSSHATAKRSLFTPTKNQHRQID